jgi:hypothetical protein
VAAVVAALGVLAAIGAGGGDGRSLAQEGAATPATPVAIDFGQIVGERPAQIVAGGCAAPGEAVAALTPLTTPEGEAQGQGEAIEAERSYTIVPLPLEDLLAGQTSVEVLLSAEESEVAIACGELGGAQGETGSIVVKLSERNGSGFSGIAFLAPGEPGTTGASLFLAGQRTVAETRALVAATPAVALEAISAPTPTVEPVQVVDVVLLEWAIDAPAELRAGQLNLVVTNEGAVSHRLVIESGGVIVAELTDSVAPGQANVLPVTLTEGEYLLYCPLGDGEHRAEGMETTLLVAP